MKSNKPHHLNLPVLLPAIVLLAAAAASALQLWRIEVRRFCKWGARSIQGAILLAIVAQLAESLVFGFKHSASNQTALATVFRITSIIAVYASTFLFSLTLLLRFSDLILLSPACLFDPTTMKTLTRAVTALLLLTFSASLGEAVVFSSSASLLAWPICFTVFHLVVTVASLLATRSTTSASSLQIYTLVQEYANLNTSLLRAAVLQNAVIISIWVVAAAAFETADDGSLDACVAVVLAGLPLLTWAQSKFVAAFTDAVAVGLAAPGAKELLLGRDGTEFGGIGARMAMQRRGSGSAAV